jgi:hypothetical protein
MRLLFSLAIFPALAYAHGYLSSPPPRGIQKTAYAIDDLKSPNHKGVCRGEPAGQVTSVQPGGSLTLGLTITAPHTGPCQVFLLDYPSLNNLGKIAEKYDCAAPGKAGPWTIQLPKSSGRKVLRWYWEGRHVSPGEPYEQCIDVNFGGGSDDGGSSEPSTPTYDGGAGEEPEQDDTPPTPTPPPQPSPPAKKKNNSNKNKKKRSYKKKPASKPVDDYENNRAGSGDRKRPSRKHSSDGDDTPHYTPNTQQPSYDDGSDHGGCQHGQYVCAADGGYKVCVWGKWQHMPCGTGTTCKPNGSSVYCG